MSHTGTGRSNPAGLRVGLIGTSWWADAMYLPALADHPDGAITALCGRDEGRARARAEHWRIPDVFTDWEAMLESGTIDALIVASANDTHYAMTKAAIERGLPVLCEKPVALHPDQAVELADMAEAAGLTTMVPFTYRWMPSNQWVKRLVDDGYLGDHRHLNMRYYAGYARGAEYAWRFDPELSGSGVIGDLGSHWLHLARWWFGEVTEIGAVATTFSERPRRDDGTRYRTAEDSAVITVRFASGAYGSLQVSAVCWEGTPFGQTHHAELHGTDGTLTTVIDWDHVQEVRGLRTGETGPAPVLPIPDEYWRGARRSPVGDTYRDVFRRAETMTREWLSAAAAGRSCHPDLREGARVQVLLAAAIRSASSDGRMIPVNSGGGELSPLGDASGDPFTLG